MGESVWRIWKEKTEKTETLASGIGAIRIIKTHEVAIITFIILLRMYSLSLSDEEQPEAMALLVSHLPPQ